jgi:CO dehydrogenase nickel-insertion accessory protein CooC1
VVIPSKSSVRTALKVKKLAGDVGIGSVHFVGNRVVDKEDEDFLSKELGEEPFAFFPDYPAISKSERQGEPITELLDQVQDQVKKLLAVLK